MRSLPLVDLRSQHEEVREEIQAAIRDIIDHSSFVGGHYVEAFEQNFASYCGASHAVGCASGTDALKLGLMASGVKPGDEVVTVPFTFIGTTEAITQAGAHPTFVDVDPVTYNMDPQCLHRYLEQNCQVSDGRAVNLLTGRRVAAIVPVHLYGFPANMAPILELAKGYGLNVVEDACQAHGAEYYSGTKGTGPKDGVPEAKEKKVGSPVGRRVGTWGNVGCFSFYPSKNLGAMGEAGALVTADPDVAERARVLRDHGQEGTYVHASPDGWNGRLDAVQAGILNIKLRRLDEWNRRRRQVAQWYSQHLAGIDIITPVELDYGYHVYHLYVLRVADRDRVRRELATQGVATGLHYPVPLHLQSAYRHLGYRERDFPCSEASALNVISLPMYPHLTQDEVGYVCHTLSEAVRR